MAERGISVVIAIIPPDSPGISHRVIYDPDLPPSLLGFEVNRLTVGLVKKMKKRNKAAAKDAE